MSPPRFSHKRITSEEFKAELDRQEITLRAFTRIWCQNLTTTTRWANGQQDIPTWVPIALTMMTLPNGMGTARMAAAAMIEADTLNPHLGPYPYMRGRTLPADTKTEDVNWSDQPVKFVDMGVDSVGYLKLINGFWVAENGDQYTFKNIEGKLTLTLLDPATADSETPGYG